jgi:two-component system, chemotaxis family, CheB/CheR fusion protein
MNKKSRKRPAAKKGAASIDSRKDGNDSPAIVVGVGASAGGTKSLKRFFAKMPTGHGVAFVLIRHIRREQKNLSIKLLKNQTALAVVEAKDGMTVLADRIHVIPPDKFLSISGGQLTLQEPVLCNGLRMPIDHFFCSLALDRRHRSIGVLLSGKGSDGSLGLSEIKAAGGRTLVEDPAAAAYPGMSQSAIDAGVAGEVMPAETLAEAVTELAGRLMAETYRGAARHPEMDADLRAVLDILRARVGHDFRCYKPGTLIRRIKRRMSLAKITSIEVYARFLREHAEEVGLLQKDLFIGVTDFFRQPQAWETLEEKVIAAIVENAEPGSEIRIWVPGCSTGKEAYSLAMLLTEQVEKSGKRVAVQIFATDSDLAALATARSGIYAKEDFGDNVSPERLKRFFVRKNGRYQVVKNIRERIVFAPQNITADPPFSRLDLISCRNLLIYLDQEVQKKIIALFHFALREGGFLFLGTAETVGDREELFEPVSKKWRIYRRIGVGRRVGVEIPVRQTIAPPPVDYVEAASAFAKAPPVTPPSRMSLTSGAQHMLLDRFAPACVMIDRKLQVLYIHGSVEDYLTFPPGELTTRVVDMAREGLRARLRGAIAKCLQFHKSVSVTARVRRGDKSVAVKTVVSPLRYPREIDGLLLITFEDYRIPIARTSRDAAAPGDVRHIEDELKITREELKSTIEQLENSNDGLKASNEEVTAANEELQSANEELETSKEELQSLNEELNTINIRLHDKVDELEGVNNDVVNLLSSTNIATVFLDRELKVKRYTPASTRLMSLIPTDTGRHIADILCRFSDETLLDDARLVLADLTPLSREVQADDGRWYIRRITPYRTQDDRIEGVVITFLDVADLKEAEEGLREAHERAEWLARFPDENPNPVMRVSADGSVLYCNPASVEIPGWVCEVGRQLSDPLLPLVERVAIERREIQQDVELGGRYYSVTVVPIPGEGYANVYGRDITEHKRAEEALRESEKRLKRAQEIAHLGSWELDLVDNRLTWSDEVYRMFGLQPQEFGATYEAFLERIHPEDRAAVDAAYSGSLRENRDTYEIEHRVVRKDTGEIRIAHEKCEHIRDDAGKIIRSVGMVHDITERNRLELMLQKNLTEHQGILNSVPAMVFYKDTENRFIRTNKAFEDTMLLPKKALEGKSLFEIYPKEQAEAYWRDDQEVIASGKAKSGIVEPMQTPGGTRLVQTDKVPYFDESGNVVGVIGFAVDITQQRQAEEALQTALQRLHALVAGMHGSILLVGEGRIEMANQAFCNYFGLQDSPGDLLGLTPRQMIDKIKNAYLHADEQVTRIWEIARQREPVIGEEISMWDGRTSLRDFIPIYVDGKSYGLLWHHTDITERKKAEQMILHAKEEWERTFDAVPDLIAILDDRHRILRVNKAMAKRLGVAPAKCVGESCHKAVHGLDCPPDFCPHSLALADGQEHVAEVHEDRLGGDFLVSATPLTDEQGRLIGSVHVARDITKLKQAEQILRERTAELEVSNRELESFSYSVSHDLRAPLRAIDGYARMILKKEGDKFDEETMRKFNVIRSSSQVMGQLIDDILTLSRVVKKQLSASKLEMNAVVREVWKELETINPERNIKLTVQDCPAAYGDRTLIKQVYANLLSNAAKFTKGRDPALIETGGYIEGNENVYYVRDNGVGFEMEYYDKLFGIFQRLHKPDEFEGTGVGLAIVERIVQRHGGRAWAEGKVNEGATFYFALPRRR